MNQRKFKLSALTKAMLPMMSVALLSACGGTSSDDDTAPVPSIPPTPDVVELPSAVNLPEAAPTASSNEWVISYVVSANPVATRVMSSSAWELTCGDGEPIPATSSDEFGPTWVVTDAMGTCSISDGTNTLASIELTETNIGHNLGITEDGEIVIGSRETTLLTASGLDQTGTDVKLPSAEQPGELANTPANHFALQLYDALGDYKEDGAELNGYGNMNLHLWNNDACNAGDPDGFNTDWNDTSVTPDDADEYGPVWYIPVTDDATQCFNVIVRDGAINKLIGDDLVIDISGIEGNPTVTYMPGSSTSYASRDEAFEVGGPSSEFTIDTVGAILLDESTMVWKNGANADVQIMFSSNGKYDVSEDGIVTGSSIKLTSTTLTDAQIEKFPHLADYPAFALPTLSEEFALEKLMKGSLVALASNEDGDINQLRSSTAIQYAGALDAIFAEEATTLEYGATYGDDGVTFRLWAPTASVVQLVVYNSAKTETSRHEMIEDAESGSWSVELPTADVDGMFYRYAMKVFQPRNQEGYGYEVTDPYSVSLSMNSEYSQVIDLDSEDLKPAGWDALEAPHSQNAENGDLSDMVLYESHVRDFSALDASTQNRGKYLAFTEQGTVPVNHLKELSEAGMTHLHLLPTFDIATINEDPDQVANIDEPFSKLCATNKSIQSDDRFNGYCDSDTTISEVFENVLPNDSTENPIVQDLNEYVRSVDSFNWGYDPFHYTVPEGSYATDAEGSQRILEYREMVMAVKEDIGMNFVVDVVYNHTNASGLNDKSVLDKVVPLYYHRLMPDSGMVETSTCCDNTAPEHAMFGKLIDDSIQTWVDAYKVDAFRWDLMGHHPLSQMQQTLEKAREVNPDVYFYGEGWNFGEVENNKRFLQATQPNLGGTGIGSFSDRLRDAVRGGSPFDEADSIRATQGFATGAGVLPNELTDEGDGTVSDVELARALHQTDLTRLGMAGNLKEFKMVDSTGTTLVGKDIDYNGQAAGYAEQPWEIQNYVSKHDNQTFWDINMYKVAEEATIEERVKMQTAGIATVLLGQAMPFNHMGGEILRSKSMQRDSYDYGDWYNFVDFTLVDNNWNKGLPAKDKDFANYNQVARATADLNAQPEAADISAMFENYKEMLSLRSASELMTLPGADEIMARVDFRNTGKSQTPGLIVMTIDNGNTQETDLDSTLDSVVVVINANPEGQSIGNFMDHQGNQITLEGFELSPVHVEGGIATNASFEAGLLHVDPWSVAVFVQPRGEERGLGLPVSEKLGDLPPFGTKTVYIAGDFKQASWDPASIKVPYANEGLYTVQLGLDKDTGYKFTLGSWDDQYGCGSDNCPSNFTEMGMYEFSLDASTDEPVIIDAELVESYVDKEWFVPGTISSGADWAHDADSKMTAGDTVDVFTFSVDLTGSESYMFKLTCGNWSECEHSGSDVVLGEGLVGDNDISFTPTEDGTYKLEFNILSKDLSVTKL